MKLRLISKNRCFGFTGAAIYAALIILCLFTSALSGCSKFVIFDDTVEEYGGSKPTPAADSVRCTVTSTDGVVNKDGVILRIPAITLRVVRGAELLYSASYSIDGTDVHTTDGIRIGTDRRLDVGDNIKEGVHDVTGVVTNGVGREKFSVSYKVVKDTSDSRIIRYDIRTVDGVLNRDSSVRTVPQVCLKVTEGSATSYNVSYAIDGGERSTLQGVSLKKEYALDCSGNMTIGGHTVTGTISNGITSVTFTASYAVTIDSGNYVVYADPVVNITAQDIPASGGKAQVKVTYSQKQTRYTDGVPTDSTITTGGKVTVTDAVKAESLGTTVTTQKTSLGYMYATVTLNGKTGRDSVEVYQAVNSIRNTTVAVSSSTLQVGTEYNNAELSCTAQYTSGSTGKLNPTYTASDRTAVSISSSYVTALNARSLDGTNVIITAALNDQTLGSVSVKVLPCYEKLELSVAYKNPDDPRIWYYYEHGGAGHHWEKDNVWGFTLTCYYSLSGSGASAAKDITTAGKCTYTKPEGTFNISMSAKTITTIWPSNVPYAQDPGEVYVEVGFQYPAQSEGIVPASCTEKILYDYVY